MALTTDDVRDIAHLARLGVAESELPELATELSSVLGLVEQLQGIDTSAVEEMAHPPSVSLRLRDDEVSEENRRDALQAPAPDTRDGYFLVPRVIE